MQADNSLNKKSPMKIPSFVKYLLGLIGMIVFTNITILICNYYNIPQVDYFIYLLWMYVVIIFLIVLPGKVEVEDFY